MRIIRPSLFSGILNTQSFTVRRGLYGSRLFGTNSTPKPSAAEKEAERLSEQAKMSQNLWNIMVPEKNMGVTHPFFLVLLALTVSLHYYNQHRDQLEDEALRKKRLLKASHSSL